MDTIAPSRRRWIVEDESFRAAVEAASRSSHALGAYACATGVHYLFLDVDGPYALSSPSRIDGEEREFTSFAARRPLFLYDEREMLDERAVRFRNLPDPRPFRERAGKMPEAIVATGNGLVHFVVGPVHAGIIEPGRFTFSSGGETVVHLDAQLGYAYRGVELHLEGKDAVAAARAVARICGSCSAARSAAYARALETLADVTLSDEEELVRLIVLELERVYNHLGDLAACASAAGWAPGLVAGMGLKEQAMRLCNLAAGHRLLFDAIVPGGVAAAALRDRDAVRAALVRLTGPVERYVLRLFSNTSVVSRWRGTGFVTPDVARAFGAVGPAGRASGTGIDVRAYAPYGAYRGISARSAHDSSGDVLARCSVKADELRESLRLAGEALAQLGDAPLPAPQPLHPRDGAAYATVEGPRGAETVAVHVDAQGRLARLHVIAASYRNWPVVVQAMGGNIVPDFPLVNKSFNLCYACADR